MAVDLDRVKALKAERSELKHKLFPFRYGFKPDEWPEYAKLMEERFKAVNAELEKLRGGT